MKIYSRTGDDGTTSLTGGRRVPKYHDRVEAYGSVDELIAWIGLLRDLSKNSKYKEFLIFIQDQLMICIATLASDIQNKKEEKIIPESKSVSRLEKEIDKMEKKLKPLQNFILPGGNVFISYCNIARCVCRRAERNVLKLNKTEESPQIVAIFLNRLADYLFVLSRYVGQDLDIQEIKWSI